LTARGTRRSAPSGTWMFYDATGDKLYVYGYSWSNYQIWEFDPKLTKWTDRTVTSPPAGVSRSYFDVTFDTHRQKIVEVGGYTSAGYNVDVWEWDVKDGTWAQKMPASGS